MIGEPGEKKLATRLAPKFAIEGDGGLPQLPIPDGRGTDATDWFFEHKKPGIREGGRVFGVKINYFEEAGAGAGAGAGAFGQQEAASREAAAAARAILVIFMWLVGYGCCLFGSPPVA
jgi:hypothetical protein